MRRRKKDRREEGRWEVSERSMKRNSEEGEGR